ncbi:hypothetical protein HMPREF0791_1064 [Staphylococcus epidermidis W23144]|nr:hypothetical protein HMPREF0791_1064 [Staphylococcus epidermidis W23144]
MLLNNLHLYCYSNRNSIIQIMLLLLCIKYDILIDGYKANTHIINLNIKGAN